jgi:hypothetical protein
MATIIKTTNDDFYLKYLQVWNGVLKLSPKEREVLAECMKLGSIIDKTTKDHIKKVFGLNAQGIANFVQKMRKKRCILKHESEGDPVIVINPKIYTPITADTFVNFHFIVEGFEL